MCGICGIYSQKGNIKELETFVGRMNNSQRHRGPDDGGVFVDEKNGLVLGHRRLSILDVSSAGHQPMSYAGKSEKRKVKSDKFLIVFNGEIYNFKELRKDLEEKGYEFKTKTDTEVILALYAEYGEESFSMLRGMFAFVLWDEEKKKLFLVRDRYGIKPLYYAKSDFGVVFASTVGAIKVSEMINLTENKDAKIYFLTFGSIPGPYTTFNEIKSVKPGYFLEISNPPAGGGKIGIDAANAMTVKENKYYDSSLPFFKKTNDLREIAVKKIRGILEESVRLHLISDAPLGVFLSGGLDSSVLAALSAKMRKTRIMTLGIDFKEKEFSEAKYRTEVVSRIKSDHKETIVSKDDFNKEIGNIFSFMDQPSIDGVNTYFVSRAAKQIGLKTVLSGIGSDEIFMGYHYFRVVKFIRLAQKLSPKFIFSLLPKKGKWGRLQWLKEKHPFYSYIALRGIFSPLEITEILKINEKEVWAAVRKLLDILPKKNELKKLSAPDLQSYFDLSFYMQNQLLKDTDFMSMAHSLEIRVPFLDHILVEYLSSLPAEMKLSGKYPKQLLIDAVSDILPRSVRERSKMGFTFPFQKWFSDLSLVNSYKLSVTDKDHWSRYWAKIILDKFKQ